MLAFPWLVAVLAVLFGVRADIHTVLGRAVGNGASRALSQKG